MRTLVLLKQFENSAGFSVTWTNRSIHSKTFPVQFSIPLVEGNCWEDTLLQKLQNSQSLQCRVGALNKGSFFPQVLHYVGLFTQLCDCILLNSYLVVMVPFKLVTQITRMERKKGERVWSLLSHTPASFNWVNLGTESHSNRVKTFCNDWVKQFCEENIWKSAGITKLKLYLLRLAIAVFLDMQPPSSLSTHSVLWIVEASKSLINLFFREGVSSSELLSLNYVFQFKKKGKYVFPQ